MNNLKALSFLVLLSALPGPARADAVDDLVATQMARDSIPGVALAVVRDGKVERVKGYGFANIEHHVPVHPDTLFKSGAVGMQFTAVLAMMLVEDGKLRLDEHVTRYLADAPRSWRAVTIRQLLNHTSGLPATPNGHFRTDYTDNELLQILYKQDTGFAAGTRWRFSYTDYVVLGLIIRKVTGQFYGDLLKRRVFAPLGMNTAQPIDELAVVPNRGAGYEVRYGQLRNAEWVSPTANSTADGTLYLSALDYAAWDGGLAARRLLKPESWAQIDEPALLASGARYPYGFGWYLEQGTGQGSAIAAWHHDGAWQGFKSYTVRYAQPALTVVVLANSDNADAGAIARKVAALIEPGLAQAPAQPLAGATAATTQEARLLLNAIARNTPPYARFFGIARLDITEMVAEYSRLLAPLGPVQDIAPFARVHLGDDEISVYRARYAGAVIEMRVSTAPDGRIGDLVLARVLSWEAPLVIP